MAIGTVFIAADGADMFIAHLSNFADNTNAFMDMSALTARAAACWICLLRDDVGITALLSEEVVSTPGGDTMSAAHLRRFDISTGFIQMSSLGEWRVWSGGNGGYVHWLGRRMSR